MNDSTPKTAKLTWKTILIGWGVYAAYMTLASYIIRLRLGQQVSWVKVIANDFSYTVFWVVLTPIVLWIAERFPFERTKIWNRVALHLGASVVLALAHKMAHGLFYALYQYWFEGVQFSWEIQYRNLLLYFDYGIPLYWIMILFKYAYEYYVLYQDRKVRASQLEAQLAQAQLQALKMQLQPHFLFNTLNAISVLIQKDPQLARKTVGRLSDLLRYSLDTIGVQQVTLRAELEFLDRYLQIEQTRFGDRLEVNMRVDPDAMNALVPNMILQPLVENSIKHGISQQRGPAQIEVSAHRQNGSLTLRVQDNGQGLAESNGNVRDGVGLSSTKARLQQLYGSDQSFELVPANGGGVCATVRIPYITENNSSRVADEKL